VKTGKNKPSEYVHNDGARRRPLEYFIRARQWPRNNVLVAVSAVVVTITMTLAAGMFWFQYRPDRSADAAATRSAISAATDGTVAILSYSSDTFDRAVSAAKSRLTGEFLSHYSDFSQRVVASATKQNSVKTTATVPRSALTDIHPNSAVVLVFVDLTTTSADRPQPTLDASSVLVTLAKVNGTWLISKFEPV
jgi:Mce-associated membrane protein